MPAKVILNPYAGRWLAGQRRGEIEMALREAGVPFDLVVTESPGHAIILADQAVRAGFSPIIAAGGDGSISEVVNGMMTAASAIGQDHPETPFLMPPVGILPLGSANDFVVNLGLPKDVPGAARAIASGVTRRVDLGLISHGGQQRYFDNNSAVGLEPHITLIQERIPRLRGVLRYLLAALIGIFQKPAWTMHLAWEGGEYHGPISLVTVGNCPLTGGVFYMTPHAVPTDGLLTFVYAYEPSRLRMLTLLPKAMKPGPGSYVENPRVHEIHSPWLRIRSEQPTPLHADGEIQSRAAQDIDYQILPGCLAVLSGS